MKKRIILSLLMGIIFLTYFVSAIFTYSGEDIIRSYSGGETVRGIVNLRFNAENANSPVTSSYPGSIKLIELIKSNGYVRGGDYECDIASCETTYKSNSETNQVDVNSNTDGSAVGFYVTGREVSIKSADFVIESSIGPSCSQQILIDVGGEGKVKLQNTMFTTDYSCGSDIDRGCFNQNLGSYSNLIITNAGLCEKMSLNPAPAYKVGANIKNSSNGIKGDLKMELYNANSSSLIGSCNLPALENDKQDRECIIEKPVTESGNYYVCVALKGGNAKYSIDAESSGNICGTADVLGEKAEEYDYNIFASPLPYSDIKNLSIADAYYKTKNDKLANYFDDYVSKKYERNCTSGCVIPIVFYGNSQTLSFRNISIEYESSTGNVVINNKLREVTPTDAKITSGNLSLEISRAGFKVPLKADKTSFSLSIDGKSVFTPIVLSLTPGFEFSLNPRNALIGISTSFIAITNENVSSSTWNFGDGIQKTVNGKITEHLYTRGGNYTIDVSVTSSRGYTSRKSFQIDVGNASESLSLLLNISKTRVQRLRTFVDSQPTWIKQYVDSKINLTYVENRVNASNRIINSSTNSAQYADIVSELIELNIPSNIRTIDEGSLPFAVGFKSIDSSYIQQISNENIPADKVSEFIDNLIYWNGQNYQNSIEFESVAITADSGEEPFFTKVKLNISKKNNARSNRNLVIPFPLEQIKFMRDYQAKEISSDYSAGTYLALNNLTEIEFILPGSIDFEEFGMYISPIISEVGNYGGTPIIPIKFPTGQVVFFTLLLIIATLTVYIALQEWYKRRYENYLFKNKDDLYNLINFIYNSRNAKISDDNVRNKLKENKWEGEQITYAFKKLDGRRTGMFEIPLFRAIEQRKIRQEIEKRQLNQGRKVY